MRKFFEIIRNPPEKGVVQIFEKPEIWDSTIGLTEAMTTQTIPPFFKDAGRGKERIWGDDTKTPQPMIINWPGLNDKEKAELIPTLSITDNWILLTHPLRTRNKSQPPFKESQRIA